MKAQTLLAIAITALGLAACGSSGGGNLNPNSPFTPNNPNPNNNNNQNNNNPPPPGNPRTGNAITLSSGYQRINEQALSFTGQNFGILKVDGREIEIIPFFIRDYNGGLLTTGSANVERIAQVMTQSSYGYVREGANAYMFAQGITTAANDMPTVGVFNYAGNVVHAAMSNQPGGQVKTGAANFTVDFGNRTISGTLTPNNTEVVLDNGIISGNSFGGTASSGAKFSGHFYGDHADEMGGTYYKPGVYTGAFGTRKITP